MKVRVFVGSTSEDKKFSDAVVTQLGADVSCFQWNQNVFEIGGNTQESLFREISKCDFSVIILTANDETTSRGTSYFTPRDNLIFEAGISFGALHPTRTFLVPESKAKLKLPSDLGGFTITQSFDSKDPPKDAMVVPTAQIRQRIQELGRKPAQEYSGDIDKLAAAAIALLGAADKSIVLFGSDLSWAPKYADVIRERVTEGVKVEVFSDKESRSTKPKTRQHAELLINAGAKVHYCERNTGIKLTLIDHEEDSISQFMISFKELNTHRSTGGSSEENKRYRYTIHDAQSASTLWRTLVRLYLSFKAETTRRRTPTSKGKPRPIAK